MNQLERIIYYEKIFDCASAAADTLEPILDNFEILQEKLACLEEYYTSRQWKIDYEDDEKGRLPKDLKRGVLSEDGIDHLLDRYRELVERIQEIAEKPRT